MDELLYGETPLDDNANTTPLYNTVENENDEIPLDNINTTVKNKLDTLNKNVINETDINGKDYPTKDK